MNIIQELEQEQMAKLTADRETPEFARGDTVRVDVKVVEGSRERIQAFEGMCIARKNDGLNSSFTIRKISYGEGVERVFPLYSPNVARHSGGSPRRRPSCQALLLARSFRQVGADRRADRRLCGKVVCGRS